MNEVVGLAGPAEIIRAKQKDDMYNDYLQKLWIEILLKCNDMQLWYSLRTYPIGSILYNSTTTLIGLQTLGEECTGIIQVDASMINVPTIYSRTLMLMVDIFGFNILTSAITFLDHLLLKCSFFSQHVTFKLLEMSKLLKDAIPLIERFHRAQFYFGGFYYQIGKRAAGVRYVLAQKWLKDYKSLYGFKLLGLITNIHLITVVLQGTWKYLNNDPIPQQAVEEIASQPVLTRKCSLCLETRNGDSATSCGHIFCWSCILDWLQAHDKCPNCREIISASRIIFLQNNVP